MLSASMVYNDFSSRNFMQDDSGLYPQICPPVCDSWFEILPGMNYELWLSGKRVAHGDRFELAARFQRSFMRQEEGQEIYLKIKKHTVEGSVYISEYDVKCLYSKIGFQLECNGTLRIMPDHVLRAFLFSDPDSIQLGFDCKDCVLLWSFQEVGVSMEVMADFAYHHEAKALVIVLLEDEELSDKLRTSTPNSIHIPVVFIKRADLQYLSSFEGYVTVIKRTPESATVMAGLVSEVQGQALDWIDPTSADRKNIMRSMLFDILFRDGKKLRVTAGLMIEVYGELQDVRTVAKKKLVNNENIQQDINSLMDNYHKSKLEIEKKIKEQELEQQQGMMVLRQQTTKRKESVLEFFSTGKRDEFLMMAVPSELFAPERRKEEEKEETSTDLKVVVGSPRARPPTSPRDKLSPREPPPLLGDAATEEEEEKESWIVVRLQRYSFLLKALLVVSLIIAAIAIPVAVSLAKKGSSWSIPPDPPAKFSAAPSAGGQDASAPLDLTTFVLVRIGLIGVTPAEVNGMEDKIRCAVKCLMVNPSWGCDIPVGGGTPPTCSPEALASISCAFEGVFFSSRRRVEDKNVSLSVKIYTSYGSGEQIVKLVDQSTFIYNFPRQLSDLGLSGILSSSLLSSSDFFSAGTTAPPTTPAPLVYCVPLPAPLNGIVLPSSGVAAVGQKIRSWQVYCLAGAKMEVMAPASSEPTCQEDRNFTAGPSCAACPAGTFIPQAAHTLTVCQSCTAGKFSGPLSSTCTPCPLGSYQPNDGASYCVACATGMSTTSLGSSSSSSCICAIGMTLTSPGVCSPCPLNTYKDAAGNAACSACFPGSRTMSTMATALDDCVCDPGQYKRSTGSSSPAWECAACEAGKYKEEYSTGACTSCPARATSVTGANSSSDCLCIPGYELLSAGCSACSPAFFKPLVGSSPCERCPAGTISASTGSTACAACLPGSYTGDGRSSGDNVQCFPCFGGTYSGAPGTSACIICSAGYYSASPGASSCAACDPGTFSSQGSLGCTFCDPGKYSAGSAATCSPCEAGKYSLTRYASCDRCPVGKYQPGTGSSQCLYCGEGTVAGVVGLTTCETCQPGTYSELLDGLRTACKNCVPGTYSVQVKDVCQLCPFASYQSSAGSSFCRSCQANSNTSSRGANRYDQCICYVGKQATDGSCFVGLWESGVFQVDQAAIGSPWVLAYSEPYSAKTLASDLSVCPYLMLVGFKSASSGTVTGAMGTTRQYSVTREELATRIGMQTEGSNTILHNNVRWYFTATSFGFTSSLYPNVTLAVQDIDNDGCSLRMGWDLSGIGGYRAGCTCSSCPNKADLSTSTDFVKLIYCAQG